MVVGASRRTRPSSRNYSRAFSSVCVIQSFSFLATWRPEKLPAFEKYKVDRAIEFGHDLEAADFPMTDAVVQGFQRLC